jgi:hypothetical protein
MVVRVRVIVVMMVMVVGGVCLRSRECRAGLSLRRL